MQVQCDEVGEAGAEHHPGKELGDDGAAGGRHLAFTEEGGGRAFRGKKRIKFAIEFEIPNKLKDKKKTGLTN